MKRGEKSLMDQSVMFTCSKLMAMLYGSLMHALQCIAEEILKQLCIDLQ